MRRVPKTADMQPFEQRRPFFSENVFTILKLAVQVAETNALRQAVIDYSDPGVSRCSGLT
jgi:hypothetical protein